MLILSECEVELVRQRCVHQFGGLALVLIGVLESGINHRDGAPMAFKVEPLHYRDNEILVSISAGLHTYAYKVTNKLFTLKLVRSQSQMNQFTEPTKSGLPNFICLYTV